MQSLVAHVPERGHARTSALHSQLEGRRKHHCDALLVPMTTLIIAIEWVPVANRSLRP